MKKFASGSTDENIPPDQSMLFNIVHIPVLSLGTADILGQKILHVGADLCTVGCLQHPGLHLLDTSRTTPVMTTNMSPDSATCPQGAKLPPVENHWK